MIEARYQSLRNCKRERIIRWQRRSVIREREAANYLRAGKAERRERGIFRIQDLPRFPRCDVIDQEIFSFIAIQYLVSCNRDGHVYFFRDHRPEIRELLLRGKNYPIKSWPIKWNYFYIAPGREDWDRCRLEETADPDKFYTALSALIHWNWDPFIRSINYHRNGDSEDLNARTNCDSENGISQIPFARQEILFRATRGKMANRFSIRNPREANRVDLDSRGVNSHFVPS